MVARYIDKENKKELSTSSRRVPADSRPLAAPTGYIHTRFSLIYRWSRGTFIWVSPLIGITITKGSASSRRAPADSRPLAAPTGYMHTRFSMIYRWSRGIFSWASPLIGITITKGSASNRCAPVGLILAAAGLTRSKSIY